MVKFFDFNITTSISMLCSLTLEEVNVDLDFETQLNFSVEYIDDDTHVLEGITIDIDQYIFSEILIEKPMKVYSPNALDEYEEATAKPVNPDGDMEGEAGLDSIEEILNLLRKDGKKYSKTELEDMGIDPDALGNYPTGAGSVRKETLLNPDVDTFTGKPKKAGGGIMKLAGDDSGPPPTSGPNSQGLALILKRAKQY